MIFKSRQVNLDPRPYRNRSGGSRWPDDGGDHVLLPFDPRPEFEPTRDPLPWIDPVEPTVRWAEVDYVGATFYEWAPRRDQFDTPVNPILVDFRDFSGIADLWLEYLDSPEVSEEPWTPDHIAHARKVLSRLAALS